MYRANTDGSGITILHSFSGNTDDGSRPHGGLCYDGSMLYGMAVGGGEDDQGIIFSITPDGEDFALLHSFNGDDGSRPHGRLSVYGSTLYGMTFEGGSNGMGVAFRLATDGSGFTVLRHFSGDDGRETYGALTLAGTNLYGMTYWGGTNDKGAIFRMQTNGGAFAVLHHFAGGATDGSQPLGSLTIDGTNIYGVASYGGVSNKGVIFRINTDGSGYTNLHNFVGGSDDGREPYGTLVLDDATLFGSAPFGGENELGVIYRMNTDGTGLTNLHSFLGGPDDGREPSGGLSLQGSTLYGWGRWGGSSDYGVLFAYHLLSSNGNVTISYSDSSTGACPRVITRTWTVTDPCGNETSDDQIITVVDTTPPLLTAAPDVTLQCSDDASPSNTGSAVAEDLCSPYQTQFSVLHHFIGGTGDGRHPLFDSPVVDASSIYGMTPDGGAIDKGVIYKVGTNGVNFSLLHNFTGGTTNGRRPHGALTFDGTNLYGMTVGGGPSGPSSDQGGTVFKINSTGGSFAILQNFTNGNGGAAAQLADCHGDDALWHDALWRNQW